LEVVNDASVCFALGSSAGENMTWSTFVVLQGDIGVEKGIDGRPPVLLQGF